MTKEEAIETIKDICLTTKQLERVEKALECLLSTPSLPSSLDEAAEEEANKYGNEYFQFRSWLRACFKAGAEWMAGQGATLEVEVKEDAGGYPYIPSIELYDYDKDEPLSKPGDKVVVQIRKK